MNRHDIRELAAVRGYPCLTITLPTHRTSPDNRQDPIRLKNMVAQAAERLSGELDRREAAAILGPLEQLVESIDHERNLDGLVLFVGGELARAYRLPYALPERAVVDGHFFLRDLVYALNRSPRYWVLALSEQPTRLFEATRGDLEELADGSDFPLSHGGPGGESRLPGGRGVNRSRYRDDHARSFFRMVDLALGHYLADDPLPVVLVGVDRWQAFFREVTRHGDQIVASLLGSHDATPAHDLGRLVWPLMRERLDEVQATSLRELQAAVGGQRSASTLGEVWRCAQEGRGAKLLVEQSYHEPATIDIYGHLHPLAPDAAAGPESLDDAVDAAVTLVLARGGSVAFVDDGALADHGRIALILRY